MLTFYIVCIDSTRWNILQRFWSLYWHDIMQLQQIWQLHIHANLPFHHIPDWDLVTRGHLSIVNSLSCSRNQF